MIQPISLEQRDTDRLEIGKNAALEHEAAGDLVAATAWDFASGPHRGRTAAYLRAVHDGYQIIDARGEHVTLTSNFDSALNHVMACAYRFTADQLDRFHTGAVA